MITVFDGPEKAGKSTIIGNVNQILKGRLGSHYEFLHRKWGPVDPDDRVYTPALQKDTDSQLFNVNRLIAWDRSWSSEHVYGLLLNRNRRLAADPWLGEWLHGRATMNKFMILTDREILEQRRDGSDLPVDPGEELAAFRWYARTFGWYLVFTKPGDPLKDAMFVSEILIDNLDRGGWPNPPYYCGPRDPRVVFIGDKLNVRSSFPGAWLPFTTPLTMNLGRALGNFAFQCGWTNQHQVNPSRLRRAKVIVSCGKAARLYVDHFIIPSWVEGIVHENIPHPSWLYRFKNDRTMAKQEEVKRLLDDIRKEFGS